jgi:catechol 2,3-dioxygenase-like lactoylglutathione lyase family enzyme
MQLRRVHHIGVMVANLELSGAFLVSVLGFARGERVEREELLAWFFRAGDVLVELVWLRDAKAREARLGGSPALLDHLAIEVDDLAKTLAALRAEGVVVATPPLVTSAYATVFTKPESSGGLRYQFVELRS